MCVLYGADFYGLFRDETKLLVNPRLYFFTSFSIPTVLSIVARRKVKECLDDMDVSLMTSYLFVTYPHALYCIIKIDIITVHLVTSFNLRSLACCYVCWILDPVFSIVNIF